MEGRGTEARRGERQAGNWMSGSGSGYEGKKERRRTRRRRKGRV